MTVVAASRLITAWHCAPRVVGAISGNLDSRAGCIQESVRAARTSADRLRLLAMAAGML